MSDGITKNAAPMRVALLAALMAGLTACGGGGGGGGGFGLPLVAPPAPAPSEATPPPAPAPAPAAALSVNGPTRAVANTLYSYTGSVSDGVASAWRWIWGDGTPDGTTNPATHVWGRPGSFALATHAAVGDAALSASQAVTVVSKPAGAGELFACAIKLDATVACWGENGYGQLGDGTTATRPAPVAVSGLAGVVGLGVGESHACALKQDGSVACWGRNTFGQLGNGNTTDQTTPTPVTGLSNVVALTAGNDMTCALTGEGRVFCFGEGQTEPSEVAETLGAVAALSAGRSHACALKGDGSVACWGSNSYGQLGDGTVESHPFDPVAVSGLSGVVALEARERGNCALKADGTVMCWGDNEYGQLGDGSTEQRATPVAVSGLSGVVALASGSSAEHSCALKADRSVVCWGENGAGQLGDGSTTQRNTPVAVASLSDVSSLTVGYGFSCALKADGSVACWGVDWGNETINSTPTMVSGGAVFWR